MTNVGEKSMIISILAACGENNAGDDIMLVTQIRNIRRRFSHCEIVIFTANRDNTKQLLQREGVAFGSLRTIYSGRWGILEPGSQFPKAWLWIFQNAWWIYKSDLLLLGGGKPISDYLNRFKLLFYVSRLLLAYLLRTPYAIIGIGVGHVTWFLSKLLVKFIGNRAVFIAVRDKHSMNVFQELGVDSNKIVQLTDLSFCE